MWIWLAMEGWVISWVIQSKRPLRALLQAFAWSGVGALNDMDYLFIFCVTQRTVVVLLVATSGQYSPNCTLACKVLQEPSLFSHWEHLE